MTDTRLPAISLHQPWANFLFEPTFNGSFVKVHETRGFALPAKHLGVEVAIHAALKKIVPREIPEALWRELPERARNFTFGGIIGTVRFEYCTSTDDCEPAHQLDRWAGNWGPGRFAWRAAEVKKLAVPFPCRGLQGWFSVLRSDLIFPPA